MAGPLSKYSFINAKLRGRISKILSEDTFRQMEESPSIDAALSLLRSSAFADLEAMYSRTGDLRLAELELLKNEIELYQSVRRFTHSSSIEIVNALLLRFEIENLKNAVRVFFDRTVRQRTADVNAEYVLHDRIIHDLDIDAVLNASSFNEIAQICESTPYGAIIRAHSQEAQHDGTLFRMEVAFDHFYYRNLLEAVDRLDKADQQIAYRLIGVEIDLQNIDWIIRLKQFYELPLDTVMASLVPGGAKVHKAVIEDMYRAQNVAAVLQSFVADTYPALSSLLSAKTPDYSSRLLLIRRILEEIMKQEVKRILGGYPFTVGIILAYFELKSEELKRLRTILNVKQRGGSLDSIESVR